MKEIILQCVLKNAFDYGGSVNPKAVLGQVLRTNPDLKKDVPTVMKTINEICEEVAKLSVEEVKSRLESLNPELLQETKKEEVIKGSLKPLKNVTKGKFVVRIAPSPSGALHIGHAYGGSLNSMYSEMYDGKFILRIEDTNPENIFPGAYELIERDAKWLTGDKVDQIIIQSDRLGIYYDFAEKLVSGGHAYVCICDADSWRELKNDKTACPCRILGAKEQEIRYAKMFGEYATGEAVLRLKTDIEDKNPAMRDFSLMRINEHIHPKTGKEHRVWPLMVFSVAIDDHEMGVTHVLNGKDHADNAKKEAFIMKLFDWEVPEYKHWGRIQFQGLKLSSSKTRIAIEQNEYTGWDDIRLPFLPALRKRGYQREALQKFSSEIGLSLNDKHVTVEEFWKLINAFNKDVIDSKSNRYFFVKDPVKIIIKNSKPMDVSFDLHSDFPKRGKRLAKFNGEIVLPKDDVESLEQDKIHRLIDCCNFTYDGKEYIFHSTSYEEYKNAKNKGRIIHWISSDAHMPIKLMELDGSICEGVGELGFKDIKEGDIVQFERMHFARLDSKKEMLFYYLHK